MNNRAIERVSEDKSSPISYGLEYRGQLRPNAYKCWFTHVAVADYCMDFAAYKGVIEPLYTARGHATSVVVHIDNVV